MIIVRVCLLIGVLAGSIASIMVAIGTFYRDVFLIIAYLSLYTPYIPEFIQSKILIKSTALEEGFDKRIIFTRLQVSHFEHF